jgi:hypothetical protein
MSRGRPSPFFHGSELRGLIVFAVVMAVGWPIILSYARPRSEPEKPRVVDNRPLDPDTGIAFQGVRDKQPIEFRDNAAYALLLKRARETPAAKLDQDARRDVFYAQLGGRPELYRGVPIHLEGTLLKALFHEKMNTELVPSGRIAELWITTPESRPNPYAVMVEDLPPGLTPGFDLHERVIVDAYFFKLMGYVAGDSPRFAPLLVGRLRWANADPKTGAPLGEAKEGKSWSVPIAAVVVMVVVYVGLRLVFQVRRVVAPATHPGSLLASGRPDDAIDPETLSNFFASVPDEGEDEREIEDEDEAHDRPRA